MKLRFKLVISFIFAVLLFVCIYQAYWLYNFYHDQFAKMEVDILTSMRNAGELSSYKRNQEDLPAFLNFYNNLLQAELIQKGINVVSFTEIFHLQSGVISATVPSEWGENEKDKFIAYVFPLDMEGVYACRLFVKEPNLFVIKQMAGLLATSFLLITLLFVSYYYLLKVIFRQKTLDEMKSDFVSNMTHELKTPLSVAYAANDALLHYGMIDDKEKREKYLKVAQEQLVYLTRLVDQILTMSVEERKTLRLDPESISLLSLFENLKQQYSLQAEKPVTFSIEVQPETLSVEADKVHFRNAICNLIENAIKYSGEKVSIGLSARRENGKTKICISDNGIGIPASALPRLFDKFYRVSTGNVHNVKGYGLGLSYVKTIIEKQGGSVSVESQVGQGSRFYIEL